MPTGTVARPTREAPWHLVHYMRKTVAFNTTGIADGVPFSRWLPAGAEILSVTVKIKAAFNAATTNVLTVGQNSTDFNDMVAAGDVDESAVGSVTVFRGADLTLAAAALAYVKYTQSGTAATTGSAVIIIEYVPAND